MPTVDSTILAVEALNSVRCIQSLSDIAEYLKIGQITSQSISTHTFNKKPATGYVSEVTVYECESCEGCLYKDKCTKAKGNRRMQVSKTFIGKRQKSYENIITEKGALLRMNRSIQSEGAFGALK